MFKIMEHLVHQQDMTYVRCSLALCAAVKKTVKKEVEAVFYLGGTVGSSDCLSGDDVGDVIRIPV
jgi:hypothetical protein